MGSLTIRIQLRFYTRVHKDRVISIIGLFTFVSLQVVNYLPNYKYVTLYMSHKYETS